LTRYFGISVGAEKWGKTNQGGVVSPVRGCVRKERKRSTKMHRVMHVQQPCGSILGAGGGKVVGKGHHVGERVQTGEGRAWPTEHRLRPRHEHLAARLDDAMPTSKKEREKEEQRENALRRRHQHAMRYDPIIDNGDQEERE
jgi:hypothetical protein